MRVRGGRCTWPRSKSAAMRTSATVGPGNPDGPYLARIQGVIDDGGNASRAIRMEAQRYANDHGGVIDTHRRRLESKVKILGGNP
jgi:hypothetical protein